MPIPKPITQELFVTIKQKYRHHWEYLGEWKVEKREKLVLCRCSLCSAKHWVLWKYMSTGKSTRCRACARIPVGEKLESINKDQIRRNSLDRFTGDARSTGKGRRQYQVRCEGCGRCRWVTMESIVKVKGCRSCALSWVQTRVKPTPGWKERKKKVPKTKPLATVSELPVGLPFGHKAV